MRKKNISKISICNLPQIKKFNAMLSYEAHGGGQLIAYHGTNTFAFRRSWAWTSSMFISLEFWLHMQTQRRLSMRRSARLLVQGNLMYIDGSFPNNFSFCVKLVKQYYKCHFLFFFHRQQSAIFLKVDKVATKYNGCGHSKLWRVVLILRLTLKPYSTRWRQPYWAMWMVWLFYSSP